MADWYREHELFYDKTRKDYRDMKLKHRLLEEKAATLTNPCTGAQLKRWLESMRTCFGKLIRAGPSGSAKQNPTDKEAWIMSNFSCCQPFIARAPGRQAVKVCIRTIMYSHIYTCRVLQYIHN